MEVPAPTGSPPRAGLVGQAVDRVRFVDLVDTALDRAAAGGDRVAIVRIALRGGACGGAWRKADRLAGQLAVRVLASRLCGHLGPRDVLGRWGTADYVVLCSGSVDHVLTIARVAARKLAGEADRGAVWTHAAVAVDNSDDAETLISRAAAPLPRACLLIVLPRRDRHGGPRRNGK